jgi:SAM-dependent methyltransferase
MEDKIAKLQQLVDEIVADRPAVIRVLEAGCGSMTHIHFSEKAQVTGIDISEKQLLRNQDIDERIVGDIQVYNFQPASFDIIICWNVLEHVQNPLAALSRFEKALKQDGIIILGLPNGLSIKGLITKYTPHVFHVWAYKHLFGIVNAGIDDNAPFKAVLSFTILPTAIRNFAFEHGLRIVYFASYDSEFYIQKLNAFFRFIKEPIKFLSLNRLGDSDFVIALQKAQEGS